MNRTLTTPYTGLARILADMLQQARQQPGAPVRRSLKHGLRIDLMIRPSNGDLRVQLSRADKLPSLLEWVTVVKRLPNYPQVDGGVAPPAHTAEAGGRHYLFDTWAPDPETQVNDEHVEEREDKPC